MDLNSSKIRQIPERIRDMREILDITPEQMAVETGLTTERYLACEAGEVDLSISFIHKCALRFGVDVSDIIEGKSPNLRTLSVVRAGNGTLVDRRSEFDYTSLAPLFRDKIAEPFLVRAAYSEEEQRNPIKICRELPSECSSSR